MTNHPDKAAQGRETALFRPGENCWRTARADDFAWLIDGEAYFMALRESLEAARHEILIVGWDIDSRVELVRDEGHRFFPSPLAQTLQELAQRNDALRIHVLSWDFAMVYVLERELLPAYRFGWQNSRQLHFQLDGAHVTGASHHQKIVVIDGNLAYVGGLDLTKNRWDTRAHTADEPRRRTYSGEAYRPFHDVQAVVSGKPARYLRELVAARWKNATGDALPDAAGTFDTEETSAWPPSVESRAGDMPVALARTWSAPDGSERIREVERLYLDMIAAAKHSIYIENQYFTSDSVTRALGERLSESGGPEVVIVLPGVTSGWLEQATMELLRDRAIGLLREADRHDRLRVLAPVSDELGDATINVHSKIMIVDDDLLRIGSANLNNRSMGLDSECDLGVETDGLASLLRGELIAEHCGTDAAAIVDSIAARGLVATIDAQDGGHRRLERVDPGEYQEAGEALEPLARLVDMETPIEQRWARFAGVLAASVTGASADDAGVNTLPRRAITYLAKPKVRWSLVAILAAGIVAGFAWAAWRDGSGLVLPALFATLKAGAAHPLAPVIAVLIFVAGSFLVVPVTAMIALCALIFDPWVATLTSVAGVLASAGLNFAVGHRLGRVVRSAAPGGVTRRMRRLADSADAWSLAGLRLIPIAPFTVFNLVAGACHVRARDFMLGTLFGMGPGILLICLTIDRARAAITGEPVIEPWLVALMAVAGAVLVALRVLQKRQRL